MKPILVTTGEPAGIGPDICLALNKVDTPLVLLGDINLLRQRAKLLNKDLDFYPYDPQKAFSHNPNLLPVVSIPCKNPVKAGQLDPENSPYVIEMLSQAAQACLDEKFSALVTAPVHKGVIAQAGIPFTGHTEFLANYYGAKTVVMLLACSAMKVALLTTHVPLAEVPKVINQALIINAITQVNHSLKQNFALQSPKILVAGLNPHAGEGGYLGREEIEIINPAIQELQKQGIAVSGPYSADTMFTRPADAFVAMYHDQGLPVLKYAGFGEAVNVSLGLPIIRTSVDHGTALELAGTGQAESSSLIAAVNMAQQMIKGI